MLMRRFLGYRLSEIQRVYPLLWLAHLLVASAQEIFFFALVSRAVGMKDGLGLVVLR